LNLDPIRLLARDGYRVHLITFEREPYRGQGADEVRWRGELAQEGIVWHPVAYHRRLLLLAKLRDAVAGGWTGWRIMRRESIALVHARSEFAAAIASVLGWVGRRPVLYESDGPISEERVDLGLWRRGDPVYRLARAVERWLPTVAQEVIVLTERYATRLRAAGVRVPITVLPCCSDVERFRRDPAQRRSLRRQMGWDDRVVLVYSGQVGGWYQFEEMADFFAEVNAALPRTHWLCLVNGDPGETEALVRTRGVQPAAAHEYSSP
jgi:glycosyltransferase involved in cell wall biosynthesis